jgi:RNA polymerase-binding transcription factor DksA
MKKSKRVMRKKILRSLFMHLVETYDIGISEDRFVDELSLSQIDALLAFKSDLRIEELRCALDRLEEGTYGDCVLCKRAIDHESLDRDPARRYCEQCEKTYISVTPGNFQSVPSW